MLSILTVFVVLLQMQYALAGGKWMNGEYYGELSVNVTQVIKGCTLADYEATNISKGIFNRTLEQTIAGTSGLSISNISSLTIKDGTFYGDSTPLVNPNITIFYRLRATNELDYNIVAGELMNEVASGTFDNLLNLFAMANNAPPCLVNSKSGSIELTSLVPTYAPTPVPTFAPTSFDTEQFGFLLKKYVIVSSIVGSILGLMILYYGYWGLFYLRQWLKERQDRLEAELEAEVTFHNRKLQQRFVKADSGASPHTSKMRENFKKQFGHLPAEEDIQSNHEDSSSVPLTNLSSGSGSSHAGGHARTLATRLPGISAPSRAVRSNEYDVEAGRNGDSNTLETKAKLDLSVHTRSTDVVESPTRSARDVDIELSGGMGNTGEDRSNRLADKGSRRAFGFADEKTLTPQNRSAGRRG